MPDGGLLTALDGRLADVVIAECPLVGDETAEYVCGRCAAPIRKVEAVLYP